MMQRQAIAGVEIANGPVLAKAAASHAVLRTTKLHKKFQSGIEEIEPLRGVDFSILQGEMVAIIGPSGAGKSTFLHILAALDTPTSGEVYFAGNSLQSLSEDALADYRNRRIGFVWQRHHLLPDFTAAENVAMPLLLQGQSMQSSLGHAREWLGEVGLANRADQQAGSLSGGEQQRVAIARALVASPEALLADEPTGDLDERNAAGIFDLMQRLHQSHQITSILATHNLALAQRADRIFVLENGRLTPKEGG